MTRVFKKTIALTCLASLLSSAVLPVSVLAVSQDKPCEGDKNISTGGQKMRANYCEAKKAADEAAKGQGAVGWVQAAVAAVCTTSCISSFLTAGLAEGWCTAASIGGTVFSVIKAKSVSDKMMALGGLLGPGISIAQNGFAASFDLGATMGASGVYSAQAGAQAAGSKAFAKAGGYIARPGGEMANQAATKGAEAADKASSHMSCLTAGISALQSTMSFMGKKDSEDAAKKAEENARSVIESDLKAISSAGGTLAGGSGVSGGAGSAGSAAAAAKDAGNGADPSQIAQNKGACGGTGFDATVNCALAQPNNGLPGFIRTPEFRNALEKMSGISADRLTSLKDPGSIMGASMGRVLSAEGQDKLASIMGDVRSMAAAELQTGAYAGGGGGAKSGGGDGMPDVNALMDKFMPKEGEKAANGKVGMVNFNRGKLVATKAGDEENRGISIFDRITRRYQLSLTQDRVSQLPYQSPENRSLSTH